MDGRPACVVRRSPGKGRSPPSLTLARDAVEEQARVRKRTRPVDKVIGRSRVPGTRARELALLHPILNPFFFRHGHECEHIFKGGPG